jgi:hypothetical protein
VGLLAALLAVLVHPVLVPVLGGYALFALHVVTRRLTPELPGSTHAPGQPGDAQAPGRSSPVVGARP